MSKHDTLIGFLNANCRNLDALRALWNALIVEYSAVTGKTRREVMARQKFEKLDPYEMVTELIDRLRDGLIKSTKTDRKEWVISHFGERRQEWVYNVDPSAFDAACERVMSTPGVRS